MDFKSSKLEYSGNSFDIFLQCQTQQIEDEVDKILKLRYNWGAFRLIEKGICQGLHSSLHRKEMRPQWMIFVISGIKCPGETVEQSTDAWSKCPYSLSLVKALNYI